MTVVLNIILLGFLSWAACRPFRGLGPVIYIGLALKLAGAAALGIAYWYVWRGGDTIEIFNAVIRHNSTHGGSISDYLGGLFGPIDWYSGNPRSIFFTRLLSPVGWLTDHNYWLMAAYLAIFSFWCTWSLIALLTEQFPNSRWVWIVSLGLLPSFLFWSSGLLKDTLANACAFYVIAAVLSLLWKQQLTVSRGVWAIVLFVILFFVRHYLAGMISMVLVLAVTGHLLSRQRILVQVAAVSLVLLVSIFSFRYFYKRLRPERLPLTVYELHEEIRSRTMDGSMDFGLEPTWSSLISSTPQALFAGLFRPGLWEVDDLFSIVQALENMVALVLTLISLWYIRRAHWDPVIIAACFFVMVMAVMLTLTTPNFGSLSRYSAGFSPIFFALVMLIPWQRYFEKQDQIG